jgi:serine/threonine protein kinase
MTKLWDQALGAEKKVPTLFSKGDLVLDQYLVIENPIHGGMGTVYIVVDSGNRKYIMKTFRIDLALGLGEDIIELFTKEAQHWTALDFHENVAEAHFVKTIRGIPIIFIEYVEGENLRQRIAHKRMNLWEKLDIAIQICTGMKFVHEVGNLLHMDIKPENTLIGQTPFIIRDINMPYVEGIELWATEMSRKLLRPVNVKITDFGIARALQRGYWRLGIWNIPKVLSKDVGGFAYWAPEQFSDPESVDERVDIYSFGVVLFEMFFNHHPFRASNIREFLKQQQKGQLQISKNIDSRITSSLKQSILQCLELKPENRYNSFSELREDLVDHMDKLVHDHSKDVPSCFRDIDFYIEFLREGEEKFAPLKNLSSHNFSMKAGSLASLGQYYEAIRLSNRALSIDKLCFDALNTKGFCHLMLGQPQEALRCFEDILKVQPSHFASLLNKGHILLMMNKDYEEALRCLKRATIVTPESPGAWSKRGEALKKLGRFKEAINCYSRALSLQPDLQEAKEGITQCLEQLSENQWKICSGENGDFTS